MAVSLLALALAGCTSEHGPAASEATSAPASTGTSRPPSSPTASAIAIPAPAPTPTAPRVADYTVLGFSAQTLWGLCQDGVVAQNGWVDDAHPGLTTLGPLTADGVTDTHYDGHVTVSAPSALLQEDGRPMAIWICEFSGDPAAPHLEHASISDR